MPHRRQYNSLLFQLAARNVRLTPRRRAVIRAFEEANGHLDAATLLERARALDPEIDRATVYRTIGLMKRLRLIDELDLMHLSGEQHFYEPKPRRDHVHLACFECGSIEEFSSPLFDQLKLLITRKTGFQAGVVRMEVGGRCSRCCAQTCGPESCTEVRCCKNGDSSDA